MQAPSGGDSASPGHRTDERAPGTPCRRATALLRSALSGGGALGFDDRIKAELARIEKGGAPKYHQKNAETGKLFARERVGLLLDEGSFVEDGALANALDPELPADGVVTGLGRMAGRLVAVMANDSTVKAGSWGRRTVEKIIRIQEQALKARCPMLYLVDSAGARITDQIEMFPRRRGARRIFYMQGQMSGLV